MFDAAVVGPAMTIARGEVFLEGRRAAWSLLWGTMR